MRIRRTTIHSVLWKQKTVFLIEVYSPMTTCYLGKKEQAQAFQKKHEKTLRNNMLFASNTK